MAECLSELERFINEAEGIDPIIKAALVHYQFETIHPFLDGNGRLGRLLITLSLMNDRVLSGAVFYPSYQLKLNRAEYYRQLMDVRYKGTYKEWVSFFCKCLLASAEDAVSSLGKLVELKHFDLPEGVKLFAKLELWNPSGSVKDRTGLYMIRDAERSGILKPGSDIHLLCIDICTIVKGCVFEWCLNDGKPDIESSLNRILSNYMSNYLVNQ